MQAPSSRGACSIPRWALVSRSAGKGVAVLRNTMSQRAQQRHAIALLWLHKRGRSSAVLQYTPQACKPRVDTSPADMTPGQSVRHSVRLRVWLAALSVLTKRDCSCNCKGLLLERSAKSNQLCRGSSRLLCKRSCGRSCRSCSSTAGPASRLWRDTLRLHTSTRSLSWSAGVATVTHSVSASVGPQLGRGHHANLGAPTSSDVPVVAARSLSWFACRKPTQLWRFLSELTMQRHYRSASARRVGARRYRADQYAARRAPVGPPMCAVRRGSCVAAPS